MVTYRKILLAEDDMDDLAIFEQVLGEKEPDIVLQHAENGLEMIAMLDKMADSDLPDLIILDQNMPKMTGRESLLFLKDSARYRHIPIILYSTYQVRDFYRECLDLGACAIVAKPDTLQGYREMISRFLAIPVGLPA
ncbi:MAG TPA: response regulator [Puia sp.]|jgi:CheY-like chemotaxis protein|nr:response regulator [Puia sp.]